MNSCFFINSQCCLVLALCTFLITQGIQISEQCRFSSHATFETPTNVVDCDFHKGEFCFIEPSENGSYYGCGPPHDWPEAQCEPSLECNTPETNNSRCCCSWDQCNQVNATAKPKGSVIYKIHARRPFNVFSVTILVTITITWCVIYVPVLITVLKAIKNMKRLREFYRAEIREIRKLLRAARRANNNLIETLVMDSIIAWVHNVHRTELLADRKIKPRKREHKPVSERLQNDTNYLNAVLRYTAVKAECEKRRIAKYRQKMFR